MKKRILSIILPLVIGIGCLFVPLLRNFHIESALVAAIVGCFWGGWAAAGIRKAEGARSGAARPPKDDIKKALRITGCLYLFGLPLLVHALITGCFSFYGLGYWLLYPWPSVLFGYAIGRYLRIWGAPLPYRRVIVIILLLAVAVGVLLLEFFHLPQVYFFNQVWGGWPGPIYDETVTVRWNLIFFRILTLLWVGLLWWLPAFWRTTTAKIIVIACGVLLILGYTHLPQLGIISPRSYLQKKLRGEMQTRHFILFYNEKQYSKSKIGFVAAKQEFYYHQIAKRLHLPPRKSGDKIQSYLYGNAWQKKQLVGAKFTSYVPVWLNQDQLHIAKQQLPRTLKHELVHVMAKQFGNKLIHASWSIGLVEGLAVALAKHESPVATINQIVRAEKPYPTAKQMKRALAPLGFYGGRAAVNYIQSGSFVQYLLNNYPVKDFKQAYRTGKISRAYKTSFKTLVAGWHHALNKVKIDSTDRTAAAVLYSFPSLFQQKCPHKQSYAARQWGHFQYYMAVKDTSEALQYLDRLVRKIPKKRHGGPVISQWAYLHLKTDHPRKALRRAGKTNASATALMLYADAFAMTGNLHTAKSYVAQADSMLQKHPTSALKNALHTRRNATIWRHYRAIVYHHQAVTDSVFNTLDVHTQARALQQAINQQNWRRLKRYAGAALHNKINLIYFSTYLQVIQWLAYEGHTVLAGRWITKVKALPLRPRFKQRLKENRKWVDFIKYHR